MMGMRSHVSDPARISDFPGGASLPLTPSDTGRQKVATQVVPDIFNSFIVYQPKVATKLRQLPRDPELK